MEPRRRAAAGGRGGRRGGGGRGGRVASRAMLSRGVEEESGDVDTSEVYKNFGRDTAIGRELFALYNGRVKYEPQVRVRVNKNTKKPHEEHQERTRAQRNSAVLERRRSYRAPKPKPKLRGRRASASRRPTARVFDRGQGRKPAAQIEAERRELYPLERPSHATGRHFESRESKIEQLRSKMERDPSKPAPGQVKHAPVRPGKRRARKRAPKAPQSEEAKLFEKILGEIEERKQFLDNMRELGEAAKYEQTVKDEIAARIEELKQLDRLIVGKKG